MEVVIRKTTLKDIDRLEEIYADARAFMRATGNQSQWPEGTPRKEEVLEDIQKGVNYVIQEGEKIVATFSAIPGRDPTYSYIEGAWPNDEPYVTIHKLAKAKEATHVFEKVTEFAFTVALNIRIDTHEDNAPMRHLLAKNGFQYCGIIYLKNGDPRLAFLKRKD